MNIPYITEFFRKRRTVDALEELLEHNNEENRAEAKRFRTRLNDQRDAFEILKKNANDLFDENEALRAENQQALSILRQTRALLQNALKDLESAGVKV